MKVKLATGFYPVELKESMPFVDNSRAVLIHRVKSVSIHKISDKWRSHYAVGLYCGNSFCGREKLTITDDPKPDKLICQRCENAVAEAGHISSDELLGRHAHVGAVYAKQMCCSTNGDK